MRTGEVSTVTDPTDPAPVDETTLIPLSELETMASTPEWLTLDPGEEVVWTGHPRIRRILSTAALAVVLSAVAVGLGVVATVYLDVGVPPLAVWAVVGGWVLLQVAGVVRRYLVTTNVEYVLTTKNLYEKTGVFSETVTRIGLDRIQNVKLTQGFSGNLFDYGSIAVSTAGSEGWETTVDDLDDPAEFRNELRRLTARASERSADADRATPDIDPETLDGMVAEARKLRESARRIERQFSR